MTVVNPKSISGINSITTGSGSDNLLTIHTSDANNTERVRVNSSGDVIVGSGVTLSPDGDVFATGVCTATSFSGSGANLTGVLSDIVEDTSPQLGGNLASNGNNINIADSTDGSTNRITVGSGGDLQLYHDTNHSYILDNGTGELRLASNNITRITKGDSETCATFNVDGSVELYHDNTKQCETSANGLAFPSGKGLDFSATGDASGMASELLDDYEEGTFTPNFDAGGGVTFSYNHQYGFYTKIGDTVTFQIYLMGHASTITGGNSGNGVVIQGLPYTILNHSRYYPAFTIGRTYHFDIDSDKRIYAYGDSNSTDVRLIVESDDTAGTVLTAGQLDNNPCLTQVGGVYRV